MGEQKTALAISVILLFVLVSSASISLVGASEMWSKTYGDGREIGNSLVETSDGAFALAGWRTYTYAGPPYQWILKTDAQGYIPEFPSWTIIPLALTATLIISLFKKRLNKR